MTEVLGHPLHVWAWWVGGLFMCLAVVLSTLQIFLHLRHYHEPTKQRLIIRILLMVPIYAIDSFVSLRWTSWAPYIQPVRNTYESYTLYSFLLLLQVYLGDEESVIAVLRQRRPQPHLFPFCFLRPVRLGRRFLELARRGTFQYVLLLPVCGMLSIVLRTFDALGEGEIRLDRGYVYLSLIEMTSVTLALYWLVLFYVVTKPYIARYKPVGKFISIKAILFLTFWQGILINLLRRWDIIKDSTDFTAENVESGLQDFLICLEMFIASVAHIFVFSHSEYKDPSARKDRFARRVRHMFAIDDAIRETRNFWKPLPKRESHESDEKGSPLLVMGLAGNGRARAMSDLELGAAQDDNHNHSGHSHSNSHSHSSQQQRHDSQDGERGN